MTTRRRRESASSSSSSSSSSSFRIVVLGSAKVGKTSIVRRLLFDETFNESHVPTVEELHQWHHRNNELWSELNNTNGLTLNVDLLDTSGSYAFPAMRKLAIERGDAFLLVYSIDDSASFDFVQQLKDEIWSGRARGDTGDDIPPIVTVGNKSDLNEKRVVKREMAETIATIDWEPMGFLECSAKLNHNCGRSILRELIRLQQRNGATAAMVGNRILKSVNGHSSMSSAINTTSNAIDDNKNHNKNYCCVS